MLLEAFDYLQGQFYGEKDAAIELSDVRSEIEGELEARARGAAGAFGEIAAAAPDVVVPQKVLSTTALRASNEMRPEYQFESGPGFVDSVLEALHRLRKPSADQARLRRQLESMPGDARATLTLAVEATEDR